MTATTATSTSKKKPNLHRIAAHLLACRDKGKEMYGRADELLVELLAAGAKAGDVISVPGGQATVVDNFAKANKAWKPCGITRFDLKVSRAK